MRAFIFAGVGRETTGGSNIDARKTNMLKAAYVQHRVAFLRMTTNCVCNCIDLNCRRESEVFAKFASVDLMNLVSSANK